MTAAQILFAVAGALAVGFLPGAALFRLPWGARDERAALDAEERLFWQIVISLAWSLGAVLVMAAFDAHSFERLLAFNATFVLAIAAVARGRLLWRGTARGWNATALVPLLLLALAGWRFFPAVEYVLGGKDPGVYVNEGIALHRTGTLWRHDPIVAAVPESARDLFFPPHGAAEYYGIRFMGVSIQDPATGSVMPDFPHVYPASVALGFGLAGTHGATSMVAVWAGLGLLAVYFLGARLFGRPPAASAVVLLTLNVVMTWFGRYTNAEVAMQTMLFAALLAVARAHQDGLRFFGGVAGGLMALLLFLRFDAFLPAAAIVGALALAWAVHKTRPRWGTLLPVAAGGALALAYYAGPLQKYFFIYRLNLPSVPEAFGLFVAGLVAVAVLGRFRPRLGPPIERYLPLALAALVVGATAYGLFWRHPEGKLTTYDAYALRTFRDAYVFWPVLVAAIAGYVMAVRRAFWRDPAFFLVFTGVAIFLLYKIRIVPEQFWMARRHVPIILPGVMLLAMAAIWGIATPERRRTLGRTLAAAAFTAFAGWQYVVAAAPVAAHREYAGAIAQVERLAALFTDQDLLVVEGRNAGSDYHVFAMPLAYLHARQVLVLESARPNRRLFEAFLAWAESRYDRVLFLGGGGTDLLSRRVSATPVAFTALDVPEFETVACCSDDEATERFWDRLPQTARRKDLGYTLFELSTGGAERRGFALDVGYLDDLNVLRFHARETFEGRTFRWSTRQSFVAVTGLTGSEREVELVMSAGGRPPSVEPAVVEIYFNNHLLGRVTVIEGFNTYRLALPPDVVQAAAGGDDPAELRLLTNTWSPGDIGGGPDTRGLGVMVDRVDVH